MNECEALHPDDLIDEMVRAVQPDALEEWGEQFIRKTAEGILFFELGNRGKTMAEIKAEQEEK